MENKETDGSAQPTLDQISRITDTYDSSPTECDGLTNLLHYYLMQAGVVHQVMSGRVIHVPTTKVIRVHRWIRLAAQEGMAIVDYRARMWLRDCGGVPHGVFLPEHFSLVSYEGKEIEPQMLDERIIHSLTEPFDIPPEWKQRYNL